MRKKIFILIILWLPVFSFANWQDVINQQQQKVENQKIKELNEDFNLEKFETEQDFEHFLVDKLYDKILDTCSKRYYPYLPYPMYKRGIFGLDTSRGLARENTSIINNASVEDMSINNTSKVSYGKTNLQKENVDEPEVLKLTKDYIAYYNQANGKVYIVKSPLSYISPFMDKDGVRLDLNIVKITDTIKVPLEIRKNSVKLFFVNNQLIVVGTRYSKYFNGDITDVVFYKIKDGKASFTRIYDVKGTFKDARITDGKLYLITDYSFGHIVNYICSNYIYKNLDKDIEILKKQNLKYKELQDKINQLEEKYKKSIDKQKILKILQQKFIQKSIDVKVDKNKKFIYKGKVYPLQIDIIKPYLNNIIFMPADFDKLNIYDLRFNLVNIIDIENQIKTPNQYIIFGNMLNGQIHMTRKSLYLVNNYYKSYPWRCRPGLVCITLYPGFTYYRQGYFTLIHKLNLDGLNLNYVNSVIIPGKPINQYSMDEDNNGNFRIFTKKTYPTRNTNLFIFNKDFKLTGKLTNIAEGEDFKSSRFIEDKAYLVTFKATDPLFVIDLKDLENPKIIGELKIPGYSLYLHPLKKEGNIQYLLGIGQEAEEVHGNWSLPKNIKIDVYKVDYNNVSGNKIKVEQTYSYVLGDEKEVGNGGSYTPVFDNPRTFVYDKEQEILFLPVYLTKDHIEKRCNLRYKYEDGKRIIDGEYCYDYKQKKPYFIGVKGLKIDLNNGISEILSKNYINLYKNFYSQWRYKNENHRVSYYKLKNDFILFEVNTNFIDLFKGNEDKFLSFNEKFNNINK